ncbi:MAG: hypothetical protein JSU86_00875 [Phycisphaerales bacterium]|nr:MAG: hypothetical protein JSU86_00875 [Phycisphaerales bacterium]
MMEQSQPTVQGANSGAIGGLDAHPAQGDHYAFLNAALGHLEADPENVALTLQVCRSYIALGLIGPARDLLRSTGGTRLSDPEIHVLCEKIARAPSGRVAWSSLQSRFTSNVARLYERLPEMREHDAMFRGIPREYELYRTSDGNLQVATRSVGGRRHWLPDLSDVKRVLASAELPHNPKALFCGPYLIAGDRFGMLFDKVFRGTEKMFLTFSPRIYVIEADVAAFGITLYVTESIERLCHERAIVFVGPNCIDRLVAYFKQRPGLPAPEFAVRLTPSGDALCKQAYQALQPQASALKQRDHERRDAVHGHYSLLPRAHWEERFRPDRKEPLRVLGLTSRFTTYLQYSMRDWGAAFRDRGHEFRVLMEESDHDLLPRARITEVIDEFKPDLIVIIDHLRREYESAVPANVPLVCWIQDLLPHLATAQAGGSLGRLDFYIARDPSIFTHQYGYPACQGLTWTMATDDRTYSNRPMSEDELAPYRCDVSYVSSHSTLPKKFHEERRRWFTNDPAAMQLVDQLFEALRRSFTETPGSAFAAVPYLLERVKEQTGLAPASTRSDRALLHSYLYPLAELMFRQSTLEWVADFCDRTGRVLHLYGNGWDAHPHFGRFARGFAHNGPELRAIYQASTINLQIIGTGAVHQRLLDGLAAGGFFLIRYTPADMIHEPAKRFLAALRKYNPAVDVDYDAEDMPELGEAIRGFWRLRGLDLKRHSVRVTALEKQRYRDMEAMDFRLAAGAVFPEHRDVAFASADEFERLAERFLTDMAGRKQVAESMRAAVVNQYSYRALVDDVLEFIRKRLEQEAVAV